jgi:type I restriction enzyme R subunit
MDNEFAPFGDARQRILGEAKTSRDIVFATYQAIADNEAHSGLYHDYPRDFFDIIIVDECHRGSAQADSRWRTILEYFESAVQIGMTATPLSTEAIQTDEYFGKPIYSYSLRAGINDGFLAAYLRQTDPLAKTIVFCVDQDHAEKMREALEQACAEYVMRYRGYIERIVSDEGAEGKRALGRFSTPEERTPVIVTTSRLLSTGVDIPTCKNIVLARPVGSLVEFKQIIGRGSRLYEPEKTWFTIIDYAGAIKLFFDPNFDGDPELVEVEPLVPQLQPQPEEGSSALETGGIPEQDTPAPFIDVSGVPGTPIVREDGTAHPQEQQPLERPLPLPPALPVPPATVEAPEEGSQQHAAMTAPAQPTVPGNAPVVAQPPLTVGSVSSGSLQPAPGPLTEPPVVVKQTRSGRLIGVIGEYVYDLGPDGKTLIKRSSYRDYTAAALKDMIKTPADLRTRWLSREQREALRDQLAEEGVDQPALAAALQHPDVDPLDLLLHVAFGQDMPTRNERVKRLYREHADFFSHYKPQAREMLNVLLEKYIAGEAADISDTELFKVPPLVDQGTFMELAEPFGGGSNVRSTLKELQQLLYSA